MKGWLSQFQDERDGIPLKKRPIENLLFLLGSIFEKYFTDIATFLGSQYFIAKSIFNLPARFAAIMVSGTSFAYIVCAVPHLPASSLSLPEIHFVHLDSSEMNPH